jgi:hypothetical protein
MSYDLQVPGNDYHLLMRDGVVVGHMGQQTFTREQLSRLAPGIERFVVEGGDPGFPIIICGVTPADALEALRRREPEMAAEVAAGERGLYRQVLEPMALGRNSMAMG